MSLTLRSYKDGSLTLFTQSRCVTPCDTKVKTIRRSRSPVVVFSARADIVRWLPDQTPLSNSISSVAGSQRALPAHVGPICRAQKRAMIIRFKAVKLSASSPFANLPCRRQDTRRDRKQGPSIASFLVHVVLPPLSFPLLLLLLRVNLQRLCTSSPVNTRCRATTSRPEVALEVTSLRTRRRSPPQARVSFPPARP